MPNRSQWVEPAYSRNEVNRAGIDIVRFWNGGTRDNLPWAIKVIDNWRAAHGYPLNTFQSTLRTKVKQVDTRAIVAQRLKRLPSIAHKLALNPQMQIARMQDIVGLRAVVSSANKADALLDSYQGARLSHEARPLYNYVDNPKPSGYRSYHLVYKYKNKLRTEWDGLQIELQIRTKVQHSWAMAVETMGVYLNSPLKSGFGPSEWKNFFSLASAAFADLEGSPRGHEYKSVQPRDLRRQLKREARKLAVPDVLGSLAKITEDILTQHQRSTYFLIDLRAQERVVSIQTFARDELAEASSAYARLESEASNQELRNIVLVSVGSIQNLRKAYPSYFLDTGDFLKNLSKVIADT